MKKYFAYLFLAFACTGCLKKKDIAYYDAANTIYFTPAVDLPPANSIDVRHDSIMVSFAYSGEATTDSLVKIPIRVTGLAATADRAYTLRVAPASVAVEGKDFDFAGKQFVIPKGGFADSARILLHRTAQLKDTSILLQLELVANENFVTKMTDETLVGTNTNVQLNVFRIYFNDLLTKPDTWYEYYLGTFSLKKFYLMGDVLHLDLKLWAGPAFANISPSEVSYYGIALQRYLNRMKAAGTPILEDDGSVMAMGIGAQ